MGPREASEPTLLASGEVHLWWGRVSGAPDGGQDPLGLSDEERSRSEAFRTPLLRRRFVYRRLRLRRVLASYLGLDPPDLRFRAGESGKPLLDPCHGGELRFNLSHTGDWVLIGVGRGRELGVDVETLERRGSLAGVAERVFTAGEQAELGPSEADEAWRGGFLRGWTRKEALLKALGTGLLRDPRGVQVGLREREGAAAPWPPDDPLLASGWRLQDLEAPAGHAAALCAAGQGWRSVLREGWEHAQLGSALDGT